MANAAQKVLTMFAGALPPGSFDLAVLHSHLTLLAALDGAETLTNPAAEVVRQTAVLLGPEHLLTRFISQQLNTAIEAHSRR